MPSKTNTYTVQRIINKRRTPKGEVQYQVKWLGYDSDADLTWEPLSHLNDCIDMVDEYERSLRRNTAIRSEPRPDSSNKNLKRPRPNSASASKDKRIPVEQPDEDEIYDEESNGNADDEYTEKPIKKQTAIRSAPKNAAPEPAKRQKPTRKPVQNNEQQDNQEDNGPQENLNLLCTGNRGKYEVLSIIRDKENKNNFLFKVKAGKQEKTISKEELIEEDPHCLLYYYEKNIQFIASK